MEMSGGQTEIQMIGAPHTIVNMGIARPLLKLAFSWNIKM
jgi:hypothetical protein